MKKGFNKLVELIGKGAIGGYLKPWQTTRVGQAELELERQRVLSNAQNSRDAREIENGKWTYSLEHKKLYFCGSESKSFQDENFRVEPHFNFDEYQQSSNEQNNVRRLESDINTVKCLKVAMESLCSTPDENISDEDIDSDWLNRWREGVKNVSQEEMQRIWGRVMAGEIETPGAFSYRTLELLKTLTQEEAELIAKITTFVIAGGIPKFMLDYIHQDGISFGDVFFLEQIGILTGTTSVSLVKKFPSEIKESFQLSLTSPDKKQLLLLFSPEKRKELTYPNITVTRMGGEILRLVDATVDMQYYKQASLEFAAMGFDVDHATITSISDGYLNYTGRESLAKRSGS